MKRFRNMLFLFLLSSILSPPSSVLPAEGVYQILTNFTAGELSPLMGARTDQSKYLSGVQTLENFFVTPQGPAIKRAGFRYISEIKNSAARARLIPFEYSVEQAYALELGESGDTGYMRVYMNGGQVLWKSGGTPYEIPSPYLAEDFPDIQYCQSADIMYLLHPEHNVYELSRSGHTAFALTEITGASAFVNLFPAEGFPRCCAFHENRLVFAGTTQYPTTVWMSRSGSFQDFTTGANDDDAIEISLASNQVNAIQWMVSSTYLTLGTTAGEWRVSATDVDNPITPTDITAKRELVYGSIPNRMAAQVGKDTLFIQRAGQKIRKLAYNWQSAGYTAPDLNVLAPHLFIESGISEIAFQQEPYPVLWAVRSDGVLAGLSYLPEHEVYGWHRTVTDGEFESIAIVPEVDKDRLYAIVKRDINGGVSRFIEMQELPLVTSGVTDAFYVDAGISYTGGSGATQFSGATHLMNTPVVALADGQVITGITVDETGGVTLPRTASAVHLGLPYTATLKTVRIESPTQGGGTTQGLIKRISKGILRLYQTGDHVQIGPDTDTLYDLDTGVSLFAGDRKFNMPGGYGAEGTVCVVSEEPLPLTLIGIIIKVTGGD